MREAAVSEWQRREKETTVAFEAFVCYRDMGANRSLAKVAEKLGKSETLMQRWSGQHEWVNRAADFDGHLDEEVVDAQEKARREMAERHAKLAQAALTRVAQRLGDLDPEDLKPGDIARILEVATKLERLSRGEPSEHVEGTVTRRDLPLDIQKLSDDELAQLEALADAAAKR